MRGEIPATLFAEGSLEFWAAVIFIGAGAGLVAVGLNQFLEFVQNFAWGGSGKDLVLAASCSPWRTHIFSLLIAGIAVAILGPALICTTAPKYLNPTAEFDRVLDTIEAAQNQMLAANRMKSKVELSKIIAHNISSPVFATDMMLPVLKDVPDKVFRVLTSVAEIKQLSNQLIESENTDSAAE